MTPGCRKKDEETDVPLAGTVSPVTAVSSASRSGVPGCSTGSDGTPRERYQDVWAAAPAYPREMCTWFRCRSVREHFFRFLQPELR
ncbi:hypothetical protein [Marmoricola sp. URHA0025 HA25]